MPEEARLGYQKGRQKADDPERKAKDKSGNGSKKPEESEVEMITVNGFWLGILTCLVAEFVIFILIGIIRAAFGRNEDDEDVEIKKVDLPPEVEEALINEIKKYEEEQNGKNN